MKPGDRLKYKYDGCYDDDNDFWAEFDIIGYPRLGATIYITNLFEKVFFEHDPFALTLPFLPKEGDLIILEEDFELEDGYLSAIGIPAAWWDYKGSKPGRFPFIMEIGGWVE